MPPQRRNSKPRERVVLTSGQYLKAVALVRYVGSPEHKSAPSFAGQPRPKAESSICPNSFLTMQEELTTWLRTALAEGLTGGPLENDFPRYLWHRESEQWYEGRLTNQALGEYKGWPTSTDEVPKWVRESKPPETLQ